MGVKISVKIDSDNDIKTQIINALLLGWLDCQTWSCSQQKRLLLKTTKCTDCSPPLGRLEKLDSIQMVGDT